MNQFLNRDNLAFTGLQWLMWSAFAVLFSFQVPYLKEAGYDEAGIGALLSALSLVGLAGPVAWGAVSDRMRSCRWLLALNLFAGGLAAMLVPAAARSAWLLLAVLSFVSLTVTAMPTVVDGWAMRLKSRGAPVNYGVIRAAGSLAYALTNMICGVLFAANGLGLMFPLFAVFSCLAAFAVFTVKDRPEALCEPALREAAEQAASRPLHRNAAFLVFVAAATLLYVGNRASMNFYPLLLQDAGGTNADLGLANGVMALSEFPVMFLSALLLKRFRDTALLLAAMAFFALRIALFYALDTVEGLVWSQLTNSLSFGLFMPVSVHFVVRVAPPRLKATALSVASSAYMGVGGVLGSLLGGITAKALGVRPMFGLAAALTAAVTALFGAALWVTRKKRIF